MVLFLVLEVPPSFFINAWLHTASVVHITHRPVELSRQVMAIPFIQANAALCFLVTSFCITLLASSNDLLFMLSNLDCRMQNSGGSQMLSGAMANDSANFNTQEIAKIQQKQRGNGVKRNGSLSSDYRLERVLKIHVVVVRNLATVIPVKTKV